MDGTWAFVVMVIGISFAVAITKIFKYKYQKHEDES